jgi:hypothetical protein
MRPRTIVDSLSARSMPDPRLTRKRTTCISTYMRTRDLKSPRPEPHYSDSLTLFCIFLPRSLVDVYVRLASGAEHVLGKKRKAEETEVLPKPSANCPLGLLIIPIRRAFHAMMVDRGLGRPRSSLLATGCTVRLLEQHFLHRVAKEAKDSREVI